MQEQDLLALGRPDFSASPWAALARDQGVAAAWRAALSSGEVDAALRQVRGAWALGWRRPDGSVLLAVDRFAVQSLCWRVAEGRLSYAARADALVERGAALEPQALFDYLFFHMVPAPRTVYAGVQRLPAVHCLEFKDGQAQVRRYWLPQFVENSRAELPELRERFLQLLERGVAAELDGSTPACYLSGGTDSSTVAGMIRKVTGGPAQAYSIGFDAQGYDEMAYARIAAQAFGAVHHEHYVTPGELLESIPQVAAHFDQPFGNSSVLPAYRCALRAKGDGVRKLLAGDGGDELFGGNARYAKQRVFGWYRGVPGPLRRHLMEPLLLRSAVGRVPGIKKAASYVEQARVAMPARLNMYNLLLRLGVAEVLTPDFLARVDAEAPNRLQQGVWDEVRSGGELNRTLAFDWRFTLAESDLPKVVHSAGLAGVAVGFPLLHEDLVDFSLELQPALKLRGLQLRWFFKDALRGFLPEAILTKSKHGFGLPFGVWAMQHPGLRALAEDSLRSLATRGWVRADFIQALLTTHLPQHPGYYGEMVWILMMAEQWLREHAGDAKLA